MRKNLSKKQLGAVGLAAMMAVQTPAMAAEVTTSPEATVQETAQEQQEEVTELQTEEVVESQAEIVEMQDQTVETSLEEESEIARRKRQQSERFLTSVLNLTFPMDSILRQAQLKS